VTAVLFLIMEQSITNPAHGVQRANYACPRAPAGGLAALRPHRLGIVDDHNPWAFSQLSEGPKAVQAQSVVAFLFPCIHMVFVIVSGRYIV